MSFRSLVDRSWGYQSRLIPAVVFCCGLLISCGEGKIQSITIARDNDGTAADEVESLRSTDQSFHAIVHFDGFGPDVKVRGELVAVKTSQGDNIPVVSAEEEVGGVNNKVDFTFSLPTPWPVGTYRVDAYVNDSLSLSKEFEIKE